MAVLALLVFAATFLAAATIYVIVIALAVGERGKAFKAVSPGMLPPMGLLFALLVGFLAAQVWGDAGRAQDAVNREASALRSVVLLMHVFPGEPRHPESDASASMDPVRLPARALEADVAQRAFDRRYIGSDALEVLP